MARTGSRGRIIRAGAFLGLPAIGIALAIGWFGPDFWKGPVEKATANYQAGRYRPALAGAVEVLKKTPGDVRASRLMARATARMGDDSRTLDLYARLSQPEMEAEDFFLLGSSLARMRRPDMAVAVLQRGRELDPRHAETLGELTRLLARYGRLDEAIDAAGGLADLPGWDARGSLILGLLDVEHGDPAGAASALDRALRADPKLGGGVASVAAARKLLAGALLRTARPGEALAALAPLAPGADREAAWLTSRAFLQARDAAHASEALARAGDFGKDDPARPEPAAHVGAGSCAGCHPSIYRDQRASRHSRTFSSAADLKALALPDKPVVDPVLPGTTHSLRRDGDRVRLTTRSGDEEFDALVEFALGSGDRGLTMVTRDDEGKARVCRISSYLGGTLWELTSRAADPQPGDRNGPLGRPMSRESAEKCIDCHVTSIAAARDRRATEAADCGIGCERCHGPGGNHLAAVALGFPEPAIARPSRASADRITRLCGACHKVDDPRTPESDPRFVRFQASTLPKSRCYTESQGALSCVTCHDPHRDAERSAAPYEARCLACHGAGPVEPSPGIRHADLAEGTRRVPCPVNPASDCLKCHMPKVEGAAPHATFTDHQIRARRPPPFGG